MSERRTDATESGSSRDDWVTPTAAIATGGQTSRSGARKGELLLSGQAQQTWVTPQARDGEQRGVQSMRERVAQGHSMSLPEQIKNWTTPTRDDAGGRTTRYAQGGMSLSAQTQQWPTAKAADGRTKGTGGSADRGLDAMARKGLLDWPTATATDAKASGAAGYSTASGRHSGTTLTDATVGPRGPESGSTSGKSRARLNHRWVAQLMGYPSDWLDGIDEQP